MQKYGRIEIENGELELVLPPLVPGKGDKPVRFATIPEFDQLTQAVFQAGAVVRAVVQEEIELIKEPIVNGGYSADEGR